ncbi:hypothetical protein VTH06DRAFT_8144 [Thermothelomyces fergusii]
MGAPTQPGWQQHSTRSSRQMASSFSVGLLWDRGLSGAAETLRTCRSMRKSPPCSGDVDAEAERAIGAEALSRYVRSVPGVI